MQHFYKALFMSAAFLASITAFELKPSKYFFEPLEALQLNCGDHKWDENTTVIFYRDNYKNLIFDSSAPIDNQTKSAHYNESDTDILHALTQLLKHTTTVGSQTLVLRDINSKGLIDVGCTVNGVKCEKTLTIPYVEAPVMKHNLPKEHKVKGKNFGIEDVIIECTGKVEPESEKTITIFHAGTSVATYKSGEFHDLHAHSRMGLNIEGKNQSIVFKSEDGDNSGEYGCMMSFRAGDGSLVSMKTKDWTTSGVGMLTSQLLLVAISLLSVFFYV